MKSHPLDLATDSRTAVSPVTPTLHLSPGTSELPELVLTRDELPTSWITSMGRQSAPNSGIGN